jgi:hypothetical protein
MCGLARLVFEFARGIGKPVADDLLPDPSA